MVRYLGHILYHRKVDFRPREADSCTALAAPKGQTRVRSILGLLTYYRLFVAGFAGIAKPLTKVTEWKGRTNSPRR